MLYQVCPHLIHLALHEDGVGREPCGWGHNFEVHLKNITRTRSVVAPVLPLHDCMHAPHRGHLSNIASGLMQEYAELSCYCCRARGVIIFVFFLFLASEHVFPGDTYACTLARHGCTHGRS
jgi:hypothetical protein